MEPWRRVVSSSEESYSASHITLTRIKLSRSGSDTFSSPPVPETLSVFR